MRGLTRYPGLVLGALIVLAGFALSHTAFYPGFMSPDSFMQFEQARTLRFTDWHPPLMSALWSLLDRFSPGPGPMLLFQLSLLWLGLGLWCWHYRQRPLAWLLPLIGLLPWVLNFAGVLWKDIGMAYALLLLAAIAAGPVSGARLGAACLLFFYAVNLRHNAIVAALPVLMLVIARWRPALSPARVTAAALGALIVTLTLSSVINYRVLGAERTKPLNFIMVDDLSYLSLKEKRSLLPGVSLEQIQTCALRTISETRLLARDVCMQAMVEPGALMEADLKPVWLSAIARNRLRYLKFRIAGFAFLLRSPDAAPFYIWQPGVVANKFGVTRHTGPAQSLVEQGVAASAAALPFLFKPYWWLCAGLLLLAGTLLLRSTPTLRTVQALLVSALLYTLAYIPVTPMADFRYVYWSVLATTLACVLLLVDWPSWRPASARRTGAVLATGLVLVSAVYLPSPFAIDPDRVHLASLAGPPTALAPGSLAHVVARDDHFMVTGSRPQIDFALDGAGVAPGEIRYLGLDFACLDSKVEPTLRVLWWGDAQPDARDSQAMFVHGKHGFILVPVRDVATWTATARITRLRINVFDFNPCRQLVLRNVTLYR